MYLAGCSTFGVCGSNAFQNHKHCFILSAFTVLNAYITLLLLLLLLLLLYFTIVMTYVRVPVTLDSPRMA
jgi:hypothetical protein